MALPLKAFGKVSVREALKNTFGTIEGFGSKGSG